MGSEIETTKQMSENVFSPESTRADYPLYPARKIFPKAL